MPQADHNALLKRIARERLAPHGMVQQGGSRTFLKDRGWFMVMIEFQPSSFARGSYLNVGADLHFFPREHMAFYCGYREAGFTEARQFDNATILFTDFKGFTQLSEQVTPAELVQELNACFKEFDALMTKYHIEKIKTIGDAYMAGGGLPDPQHGSPADVVRAALEMQDFMEHHKAERNAAGKPYFEMRVGIHSGPVVAGIVGVKKFQYDIWGDTVNTASRMESSGEVGQVNISEATYALVKNEASFTFIPRGKVQAKGKGEMEMYFVEMADHNA